MNLDDPAKIEAAIQPNTRMIWLESPTNPLIKTTDIRRVTAVAKKHNLLTVVDSTFMSPYLQRPLELGADLVVHSVTKWIAGHSDVLMGAVLVNSDELNNKLRNVQNLCGAVPSPFDCYMALRGMKTLPLRMDCASSNAQKIAEYLETHPLIESVSFPGLPSYPMYDVAKGQTDGPGGVMAINIRGGLKTASLFLSSLKIFGLAVSLGAVESLACSPAIMTHGSVPLEVREKIGLTDSLIRMSIGIEHVDDLIGDLQQALAKAQTELEQR
jgi:cystathionine gamma-lyase